MPWRDGGQQPSAGAPSIEPVAGRKVSVRRFENLFADGIARGFAGPIRQDRWSGWATGDVAAAELQAARIAR
ncbi:MAG TPA: hypothetical protein ENI87_04645 [bacterium]|nr:hypothetical protein [bacterium]